MSGKIWNMVQVSHQYFSNLFYKLKWNHNFERMIPCLHGSASLSDGTSPSSTVTCNSFVKSSLIYSDTCSMENLWCKGHGKSLHCPCITALHTTVLLFSHVLQLYPPILPPVTPTAASLLLHAILISLIHCL